jgi:hypothetical protein
MSKKTRNTESVEEIISKETGYKIFAFNFFKNENEVSRKNEIKEIRVQAEQHKNYKYLCACCKAPVQIYGGSVPAKGKQKHHFRHARGFDSKCEYRHNNGLTKEEINRNSYFRKRESKEHRLLKARIRSGLEGKRKVTNIEEEKWKIDQSNYVKHTRRRPDINFNFNGVDVVFEIQVNQLFVSIITDRANFYRDNKAYLIWIIEEYDPKGEDNPFYHDDIAIIQNRNVFIYDEECIVRNSKSDKFHLKCIYQKPVFSQERMDKAIQLEHIEYPIKIEYCSEYITLDDIQFDEDYRAYYFDFKSEHDKIVNDAIQRDSSRVFGFRESSKSYSFLNEEWSVEANLQAIIDKLREGTRAILEYERTEEFAKSKRLVDRKKEMVDEMEQGAERVQKEIDGKRKKTNNLEISVRELDNDKQTIFEAIEREERTISRLEGDRIGEIEEERRRIAQSLRRRKREDESIVDREVNRRLRESGRPDSGDLQRARESFRNSQRENEKLDRQQEDLESKKSGFENYEEYARRAIERETIDIQRRIEELRERRKNIETEISKEFENIRGETGTRFKREFESRFEPRRKREVFDSGFQAWEFLRNFNERKSLFERIKNASVESRKAMFRKGDR